jgi:acetyltransferase
MGRGGSEPDTLGLEYFYNPRSIAIVGASEHQRKPGGRPLAALLKKGYAGKVFPVNPSYTDIGGTKCYPSVLDVPEPIDMAIISVPADSVLGVLERCVKKGVKAAVIFSAGFSEVGAEGEALQQKLTDLARESGIRLLGPNCLGLMNLTNSVLASFAFVTDLDPVSPMTVGFVTQSGAFGAMMYEEATLSGVGFSSFTSVGNEADLEFSDFVGYLPQTELIGGYLEGAKSGAKLRSVAEKALRLKKPMLIMKVGRTGAGARAAESHTGSLAGDDQVYDAFFRQMGMTRIEDLSELVAFCMLHRDGRSYEGKRVAILSGSGGRGVWLADKCESLGLVVPEITGKTRAELESFLPSFASARNPIDLTAQAAGNPEMSGRCIRALVADDNIDVVFTQAFFHHDNGMKAAQELVEIYQSTTKPIVVLGWRRGHSTETAESFELVKSAGIPILDDGIEAAKAIANLAWYQKKARQFAAAEKGTEPYVVPGAGVDDLRAGSLRRQGRPAGSRPGLPRGPESPIRADPAQDRSGRNCAWPRHG